MLRPRNHFSRLRCALALLASSLVIAVPPTTASDALPPLPAPQPPATLELPPPPSAKFDDIRPLSPAEPDEVADKSIVELEGTEPGVEELPLGECYTDAWTWHWVPVGLMYHNYLAGVHEPRMALVAFSDLEDRFLWDCSLGGRVGFLRYGNDDPINPEGYQLDFYGAAIARLDADNQQDLDATDYVFGFPITYSVGQWRHKFGYAHLSSHLGDELAIRLPATLANRVNYVRDSLVYGVSYYPTPAWRVYGEAGWAFHRSGGAGPWDSQFGTELSRPGPTGPRGTPFFAMNVRLRDDRDFGGDVNFQAGWLRRNILDQTLRIGAQFYSGKSSQFQFFDNYENQLGLGLWYDF